MINKVDESSTLFMTLLQGLIVDGSLTVPRHLHSSDPEHQILVAPSAYTATFRGYKATGSTAALALEVLYKQLLAAVLREIKWIDDETEHYDWCICSTCHPGIPETV